MTDASRELKRVKRALRREILLRRNAMPPEQRERASGAICERGLQEIERRHHVRIVMAFWSFGSEVSTQAMIERLIGRGLAVALPRIVGGELQPRTYRPGDAVTETSFGAWEPSDGEILGPGDVDVIVLPGLAFDRRGHRIGYGGGFYDRFLGNARPDALRLGVCFSVQIVEEVPAGAFDLPVDVVVTERESIRCRPASAPDPS